MSKGSSPRTLEPEKVSGDRTTPPHVFIPPIQSQYNSSYAPVLPIGFQFMGPTGPGGIAANLGGGTMSPFGMPLGPLGISPAVASPWTQAMTESLKPPVCLPKSNASPEADQPGPSPHSLTMQSVDDLNGKSPVVPTPVNNNLGTASDTHSAGEANGPGGPPPPPPYGYLQHFLPPPGTLPVHVEDGNYIPWSLHIAQQQMSQIQSAFQSPMPTPGYPNYSGLPYNPNMMPPFTPFVFTPNGQPFMQSLQTPMTPYIPPLQMPTTNSTEKDADCDKKNHGNTRDDGMIGSSSSYSSHTVTPTSDGTTPSSTTTSPESLSSYNTKNPSSIHKQAARIIQNLHASQADSGVNSGLTLNPAPKVIPRRKPTPTRSNPYTTPTASPKNEPRPVTTCSIPGSSATLDWKSSRGQTGNGAAPNGGVTKTSRPPRPPRSERYWLDQQERLIEDLEKRGFSAEVDGDGMFSCSLCDKSFETKLLCVRHAVDHLEYKPFKCEDCEMEFTRCDTLQRHLKGRCTGIPIRISRMQPQA